jgi:hypothetical protein
MLPRDDFRRQSSRTRQLTQACIIDRLERLIHDSIRFPTMPLAASRSLKNTKRPRATF